MRTLVFATALLFMISCTSSTKSAKEKWSDDDQKAFSTECVTGATQAMGEDGAKKYCDCMLTKIMDKYPKAEDAGKINMDEMTSMAKDCM